MAHFEIRARSIHGTTQTLRPETSQMFDLWGPLYQGCPAAGTIWNWWWTHSQCYQP